MMTTHVLVALLLVPSSVSAFAVMRPDTSVYVENALKITASFGIDSPEAILAWETVEEMDASDNSQATAASLETECPVEETPSPECVDYGLFLDELKSLRDKIAHQDNRKASLAQTLKNIKLSRPESQKAKQIPELAVALQEAQAATNMYGITSTEAKLAWETYEEVAASGLENAILPVNLADECLVESGQDACAAIEEMDRVMAILLAISE